MCHTVAVSAEVEEEEQVIPPSPSKERKPRGRSFLSSLWPGSRTSTASPDDKKKEEEKKSGKSSDADKEGKEKEQKDSPGASGGSGSGKLSAADDSSPAARKISSLNLNLSPESAHRKLSSQSVLGISHTDLLSTSSATSTSSSTTATTKPKSGSKDGAPGGYVSVSAQYPSAGSREGSRHVPSDDKESKDSKSTTLSPPRARRASTSLSFSGSDPGLLLGGSIRDGKSRNSIVQNIGGEVRRFFGLSLLRLFVCVDVY